MSEWRKVKLSEVLTHKKGSIKIDDDIEYKLCRVQLHRRGILLRSKQFGHQIKTKKQQVCQAGDLIVAEMDAKFGGYGFIPAELEGAIVSSHYYLYELHKNKISQDYFQTLIRTDYIQNQIEAKGSTNYSSIRAKEFLEYEIPLASQELQAEISKRFLTFSDFTSKLNLEHESQHTYLTQLRQAILQEAIEGKLTADWRVKNPVAKGNPDFDAAALLETITAEKQKLIAEGKIKKEKALAPINLEDVPFVLPDGWVWVRLSEVAKSSLGKMLDKAKNQGEYQKYLRNLNVRWFDFNLTDLLEMRFRESEKAQYTAIKGDVLICEGGYPGRAAIWKDDELIYFQKAIHKVRFYISTMNKWFLYVLFLSDLNRDIEKYFTGSGIQHFTGKELKRFLMPLPPLAEQHAIVERVDRLLASVNTLEQQVQERKTYSEQLMQAVLKEAFAG